MKVELDLSNEQLVELDKGLTNLLSSLSDEQKTDIIRQYLQDKMDNNFYEERYSYSSRTLTSFGKAVIEGLRDKVTKNITNKLLKNDRLVQETQEIEKFIIENFKNIMEKAMVDYILDNILRNKDWMLNSIIGDLNRIKHKVDNEGAY